MKEYTDGYTVQVNWEFESVITENYTRAFCMSDLVTGASCWAKSVPLGHDSLTKSESYTMTVDEFSKVYAYSKNINAVNSKSFGTLIATSMPLGWQGTWEQTIFKRQLGKDTI
jgi:hypothetical protein